MVVPSVTVSRCSFSSRRDRHRADTAGKRVYRYGSSGGAAVTSAMPPPHGWRGATLPRSVTVGDRLAQKSDRHRPLSLRPVSLRRRIYMQFLLIVLLCRGGFADRGDFVAATTSTAADTSVIPRTVTTGRVQWLPKK